MDGLRQKYIHLYVLAALTDVAQNLICFTYFCLGVKIGDTEIAIRYWHCGTGAAPNMICMTSFSSG
jgi:hypothetical protein